MKYFRWIIFSICVLLTSLSIVACDEDTAKVTEIYVEPTSIELVVEHNSDWTTEGIIVKAILDNGKEKELTDVEFSQINTAITGEQTLTVTYGVYTCEVTITVVPTVDDYELNGVPTIVNHNSTLDLTGASLKVNYSNGTSQTIPYSDLTIAAPSGTSVLGDYKYSVVYGTTTLEFDYTVVKVVTDIAVSGVTVDEIIYNTQYDITGISAVVTYSDGDTKTLSVEELNFTLPNNQLGTQTLTVAYTDSVSGTTVSESFDVEVIQVLESISVGWNYDISTAGYYVLGEDFDDSQFKVYANYSKDKNVLLTSGVEITNKPDASSVLGNHTVNFSYNGKTATKDVKVVESYADIPNEGFVVTSIEIEDGSVGAVNYGQDADLSNLVLIATYNNDEDFTARLDYGEYQADISVVEFNKTPAFAGSATTAISKLGIGYKGLTAEIDLTVNRVLQSLFIDEQAKTEYAYGEIFTAPTVYAIYTDNQNPVAVTVDVLNIGGITNPSKESFTNNQAKVTVTYKYDYDVLATSVTNTFSHEITINDVVTGVEIVAGTLADNIYINTNIDTSNLQIKETYASGNLATVAYSADKYQIVFNNAEVGDKDFIVKLKSNDTVSSTAKVLVRNYYVSSINFPDNYASREITANEYVDQLATNAGKKGYVDTTRGYKVGDDNAFIFSPILMSNLTERITDYKLKVKVYIYSNDEYVLLTDNILDYVEVDTISHTFDFTENAIGERFKLELGVDFTLLDGDVKISDLTFEFEVIDGWNAYTAADLSLIDNTNDEGKWTALKTANGLLGVTVNGIVLHASISIDREDIPSVHIYSNENRHYHGEVDHEDYIPIENWEAAGLNGYMVNKDYYVTKGVVYKRTIYDGESFNLEGNYYTISIRQDEQYNSDGTKNDSYDPYKGLPKIKKYNATEGEVIPAYTSLFAFIDEYTEHRFLPEDTYAYNGADGKVTVQEACKIGREDANEETCTISNLSLMGNSQKSEKTGEVGMVCYKTENVNFTMDNCLSQAWYIAHYLEGSSETGNTAKHTLKNCTTFDSYNTLMYVQAVRDLTIDSCVMIGAGGPVMICDDETDTYNFNENLGDTDSDDTIGGFSEKHTYVTNVTVKDSNLMSWVSGDEAWFKGIPGANALAGSMKAALGGLNQADTNFCEGAIRVNSEKVQLINIIAVYKDSSFADATGTCLVEGTFKDVTQKDGVNKFAYGLDYALGVYSPYKQLLLQTFNGVVIDPSPLQDYQPPTITAIDSTVTDPNTAFALATTYIGAYFYNGIGAVLGMD